MIRKLVGISAVTSLLIFSSTLSWAQESDLALMLTNSERPEEDKARDDARRPAEVLAIAVGPNGKVISHNVPRLMSRENVVASIGARRDRHDNIEVLVNNLADGVQTAEIADIGPHFTDPSDYAGRADAAITALNMHDFVRNGEESAQSLLSSIYTILKPGGIFGVIDHRGIEGRNNTELHRITDEELREQLVKAGFVVEAESDILSNPMDDHSKNVFDDSLERNTDRILVRARKPVE